MRNKKFLKPLLIVMVIVGILLGLLFGLRFQSKQYARAQAEKVRNGELTELYNEFAPELQNYYKDEEDFLNTFGGELVVEPISEVRLERHEGSILSGTYRYNLVREDDNSLGYTVDIEQSAGPLGKKIKNITIQPVRFTGLEE